MSYIYRLAGEDLELAEAELKGFLKSQGISEDSKRTGRIVETVSEPSQLKRLAKVHEVSEKIFEGELEDFEPDFKFNKSFKVKVHDFSDASIDKKEVEKALGRSIDGDVDLERPSNIVHAYFTDEDNFIIGLEVLDNPRNLYENRKNQERPFSSPISMDPVLARTLVNLSGIKPGEHLLDPLCGTGGILIEAGLCGVGVHGVDIQEEMVQGTKKNLEEYGIISHDIRQGDINEIGRYMDLESIDVVITDLPYGKASFKNGDPIQNFLEFVERFDGKVVFVYDEPELGGFTYDYEQYIHGSLTRYIYFVDQ